MSDVQSIVAQINGSPNKGQIIDILQQVLSMLQNGPDVVPSSMMSPEPPSSMMSPEPPSSMMSSSMQPVMPQNPNYISKEDNPLRLSRAAALNIINAETYDRLGNRVPGNTLTMNWGKGQRYLNANKTKGAMLKFNGSKYYGGRRRTRR